MEGAIMDLITLSLAKGYANKVAAGFKRVEVQGSNLVFTLNDDSKATVAIPTPADGKDGVSVIDLSIDSDGSLLCHMSNGTTIDAGYVPTVDPDLTNYYTKEEIDKEGFIGIGTLEFKENANIPGLYEYWIYSGECGSFNDVYFNKEPIEIIWDGTSYILESDGNSDWGNLDDFPCYLSLGSERIFTNDTSKYHKVIVKDIRGNVLIIGNKIPKEYIDLSTNPIKTSELDNDSGFLSIERLKFTKDDTSSYQTIYYYSLEGCDSFIDEAGHDSLDVIWDGVSYHVGFDESGMRWGNYNYQPFDISPVRMRIETLDASPYHTVIIKNSKGTVLFGNVILEEYIKLNNPDISNYFTKDEVKAITGQLNDLSTENKTNLVNAINEVFASAGGGGSFNNQCVIEITDQTTASNFSGVIHNTRSNVYLGSAERNTLTEFINKAYVSGVKHFSIVLSSLDMSTSSNSITFNRQTSSASIQNKTTSLEFYTTDSTYANNNEVVVLRMFIQISWTEDVATVTSIYLSASHEIPYLHKNNYTEYTPTANYHPATKKYVDDIFNSIVNGDEVSY